MAIARDGARYPRSPFPSLTTRRGKFGWGGLPFDPTTVLFVSLFLALFAFFVVMNANSSERTMEAGAVMASLHRSFGGDEAISLTTDETRTHQSSEPISNRQVKEAYEMSAGVLPEGVIGIFPDRDGFEITIAAAGFFVDNTSRLAPSRELLLKAVAEVTSEAESEPVRITIGFSSDKADLSSQRRAAALAATLGKYGFASDRLSVIGSKSHSSELRLAVKGG